VPLSAKGIIIFTIMYYHLLRRKLQSQLRHCEMLPISLNVLKLFPHCESKSMAPDFHKLHQKLIKYQNSFTVTLSSKSAMEWSPNW